MKPINHWVEKLLDAHKNNAHSGHWAQIVQQIRDEQKKHTHRRKEKMNYPEIIYADTDLVCGDEPSEGHEKYVRFDEYQKLLTAVNNLVQIVEGVRNVRWAYENFRLVDTPEWCALYTAWSRDMMLDAKPANEKALP